MTVYTKCKYYNTTSEIHIKKKCQENMEDKFYFHERFGFIQWFIAVKSCYHNLSKNPHKENLWWHHRWEIWHHDTSLFSVNFAISLLWPYLSIDCPLSLMLHDRVAIITNPYPQWEGHLSPQPPTTHPLMPIKQGLLPTAVAMTTLIGRC